MPSRFALGVVIALSPLLLQCHDDDVGFNGGLVGGDCRDDRDCAEECKGGKDFPYGTCTVECRDDRDCPASTWCVDKAGGVCLLDCYDSRDCRDGYACKSVDRRGSGGRIDVCIGR